MLHKKDFDKYINRISNNSCSNDFTLSYWLCEKMSWFFLNAIESQYGIVLYNAIDWLHKDKILFQKYASIDKSFTILDTDSKSVVLLPDDYMKALYMIICCYRAFAVQYWTIQSEVIKQNIINVFQNDIMPLWLHNDRLTIQIPQSQIKQQLSNSDVDRLVDTFQKRFFNL